MDDVPCSRCKYNSTDCMQYPCCECKGTAVPITDEYKTRKSYFEPKGGKAKAPRTKADQVDHPSHYAGKYECIDVMVDVFGPEYVQAFCLCNAFKYLYRCMKKHEAPVEDIEKAEWYLTKFLKLESVADGE